MVKDRNPADDSSDDERPARRRRKRQNRDNSHGQKALISGLALGGVLVMAMVAGALWAFLKHQSRPSSLDDPRVTRETFDDVNAERTLTDLETLLGPARKVSRDELPLADQPTSGKADRATIEELERKYQIRSWYLWTGKDRWVFAGFRTGRSSVVAWYFKYPNGEETKALLDSEETLP
jgi:hypothetical protein